MQTQPTDTAGRGTILVLAKTLADLTADATIHGEYEKARQYAYAGISLISAFNHRTRFDTDHDRKPTTFTRPTPAFDTLFTVSEAMRQFPTLSEQLSEAADQAMSAVRDAFYDCYLNRKVSEPTPAEDEQAPEVTADDLNVWNADTERIAAHTRDTMPPSEHNALRHGAWTTENQDD